MHRRDCVAPPLRSYSVAPFGAKMIIGITCCSAHVLAFQIAAKNENLTLGKFRDVVRSKSLVNLLHISTVVSLRCEHRPLRRPMRDGDSPDCTHTLQPQSGADDWANCIRNVSWMRPEYRGTHSQGNPSGTP